MAQIPAGYLRALTLAIKSLVGDAQLVSEAKIRELLERGEYASPAELVEDLFSELEPIISATASSSASYTAGSYDLLRMAALGQPMGASPYPHHDPAATREAFYAMAYKHDTVEAFLSDVMRRIDYEAKVASGVTMTSNGARDSRRPRFARIPQGPTTCPFCIMLASRGFDYVSAESAGKVGEINRFHDNCDCKVVPQWGGESYEGYDPDAYLDQYVQLMEEGVLNGSQLQRASERAAERRRLRQ